MVIRKGRTGVRGLQKTGDPKCCSFIGIVILIPKLKTGEIAQKRAGSSVVLGTWALSSLA